LHGDDLRWGSTRAPRRCPVDPSERKEHASEETRARLHDGECPPRPAPFTPVRPSPNLRGPTWTPSSDAGLRPLRSPTHSEAPTTCAFTPSEGREVDEERRQRERRAGGDDEQAVRRPCLDGERPHEPALVARVDEDGGDVGSAECGRAAHGAVPL